jgi:hypothetical protein
MVRVNCNEEVTRGGWFIVCCELPNTRLSVRVTSVMCMRVCVRTVETLYSRAECLL